MSAHWLGQKQALIFDFDGTLVDTSVELIHSAHLLQSRYQLPPTPVPILRQVVGEGVAAIVHTAFGVDIGSPKCEQLSQEYLLIYQQISAQSPQLYCGIHNALLFWQQQNKKLAIASNKPRALLLPILANSPIADVFDLISCADDKTAAKPAPDLLLQTAQQLQLKPQDCIYIGDDVKDASAALAANMDFIHAHYGSAQPQNPSPQNARAVLKKSADLIFLLRD